MADQQQFPIGQRISLPGHFADPVVLDSVRPLGDGSECRVRLRDGSLEEVVLSRDETSLLGGHVGSRHEGRLADATEAAGEGINRQFCHLMINYDMPWNPTRLEQRLGRIHRIGQRDDCYAFNFVATSGEDCVLEHAVKHRDIIRRYEVPAAAIDGNASSQEM
jgi:hypothetical protein